MAINPNVTFVAGAIFTASQANRLPFGIVAKATSTTNYTLTTTMTATTGMSVTWTAIANRNYKITYYEPYVETTSAASGQTNLKIFQTSTAGTQINQGWVSNSAAVKIVGSANVVTVSTFSATSITVIGAAATSSTTGTPLLGRNLFFPAQLIVEDMGPA
jgi:hypothetical protein